MPRQGFRRHGGGGKSIGDRIAQVGWVVQHERDVLADFRVIYRLSWTEALALPGPEFFALLFRLPGYDGMMRKRVEQMEAKDRAENRPGTRVVKSEQADIEADPILRDLIEFG